jgi:nicotinic acid mononucleotide adenylyltransferase
MHEVLAPYFAHHRVIAATRGEFDISEIERYLDTTREAHPYADRILPLDLHDSLMHVSSSAVRERVDDGLAVDVPPGVHAYIREHRLYGADR